MNNRTTIKSLLAISAVLVFIAVALLFASAPNQYTLIHYYGWFPGNWYVKGGTGTTAPGQQNISPSNQCGSSVGTHQHSASIPNDIAAVYYPVRGKYSSSDTTLLNAHRDYITTAGVKAAILSYGQDGQPSLSLIQTIATQLYTSSSIRIAFGIRDYYGRKYWTVQTDIQELLSRTQGKQYRVKFNTYVDDSNTYRPVFYLYAPEGENGASRGGCGEDVPWGDWGCIFRQDERGWQPEPFIVLGHNAGSITRVIDNGFDGGYDYSPGVFHSASFYSDKSSNAWDGNWMYSAGVAPGYNTRRSKNDACRVRTPNGTNSYTEELTNARSAQPHFINVISFNEWNEGSQIEPAQTNSSAWSGFYVKQAPPCTSPPDCGYQYIGYLGTTQYPTGPNIYLNVTRNTIGDSSLWSPRTLFPIFNN
jgi:glycoprotein endo-alpha-1,2-mannosidase